MGEGMPHNSPKNNKLIINKPTQNLKIYKTLMKEKIKSILGDDSDLICIKCKKKRKMKMSAYCPKCKKEYEKALV